MVSAVSWPLVASGVPEDPVSESEDMVSTGGVSLDGSDALGSEGDVVELSEESELLVSVFVESSVGLSVGSLVGSSIGSSVGSLVGSSVGSSVGSLVGSSVESSVESSVVLSIVSSVVPSVISSVVSVDVELPDEVRPLVSVVLDDRDVSVKFERAVRSVMYMQLNIEIMLEISVLFMSVGSWIAGIRQVVVVVVLTPDVTFEMSEGSVRLALYAPAVTFEIAEESILVLL